MSSMILLMSRLKGGHSISVGRRQKSLATNSRQSDASVNVFVHTDEDMIRFYTSPECDRQINRQTNGQRDRLLYCIACPAHSICCVFSAS